MSKEKVHGCIYPEVQMGQENHAQISHHCDQVYDQEDSKERHLQHRVIGDPHENKFGPTFVTAV